jgi:hypothetical protein
LPLGSTNLQIIFKYTPAVPRDPKTAHFTRHAKKQNYTGIKEATVDSNLTSAIS